MLPKKSSTAKIKFVFIIPLIGFIISSVYLKSYGSELLKLNPLYGYGFNKGFVKGAETQIVRPGYADTLVDGYDSEPNWFKYSEPALINAPEVMAESAILVDLDSGQILFEKNSRQRREIASLVKIMTAVVVLEHAPLDKTIEVSEAAASIGENMMGVSAGEVYTVEELLYGLMLPSGNDAAYTLAEGVGGDTANFIGWMNIKANELGLKDTHFADPSGLDDATYSSAVDLLKLSRYAMKFPEFRKIVKTYQAELSGDTHKYLYLENQTNLLTTYPGVEGVKTGYTEEAGLCLVTYANNQGKEVIGVVLDSTDRKGDMILMLDYGYSRLGVYPQHDLLNPM